MVLKSSQVAEQLTSSDRETLITKKFEKYVSIQLNDIIQKGDKAVFIRGVGGTGKTTMLEMLALRWAKKEAILHFDFVFMFTCREINTLLGEISTVEELFRKKYPKVFDIISLKDLESISDRVLIIVDGLDELQDVYKLNNTNSNPLNLKFVLELIDTKNGVLKQHKIIACGRPKACELVKQQFDDSNPKTIEVCGFSEENIKKYVKMFFGQNEEKAKLVREALDIPSNLKVMATVPVFLWVICCVYREELVKKQLNTYTELYIYATLVFLRNHFRGNLQLKKMTFFELLEKEEIMQSVHALMTLSVQTYMENKVLFTESDIGNLKCPTHLEKTGFIVKYNRGVNMRPVYQFKHLVMQEFFCGLCIHVTKLISPHFKNDQLSGCAPIIFGTHRLLMENENELFVSFFNKLSDITRSRRWFFTEYFVMPFYHRSFNR